MPRGERRSSCSAGGRSGSSRATSSSSTTRGRTSPCRIRAPRCGCCSSSSVRSSSRRRAAGLRFRLPRPVPLGRRSTQRADSAGDAPRRRADADPPRARGDPRATTPTTGTCSTRTCASRSGSWSAATAGRAAGTSGTRRRRQPRADPAGALVRRGALPRARHARRGGRGRPPQPLAGPSPVPRRQRGRVQGVRDAGPRWPRRSGSSWPPTAASPRSPTPSATPTSTSSTRCSIATARCSPAEYRRYYTPEREPDQQQAARPFGRAVPA